MPRLENKNGSIVNVSDEQVEQVQALGFTLVDKSKTAPKKAAAKSSAKS